MSPTPIAATTRKRWSRTAWRAGGSIFGAVMLAWGTLSGVSALAHETTHVHRVIDSPVRMVDVDAGTGGSITVVGGSTQGSVSVDMTLNRSLATPWHTETVQGDRLVMRSNCRFSIVSVSSCGVDYVIHVRAEVSVVARSDGGKIAVSNVSGDLDLVSSGGGITVRDATANQVRLSSDGGSITAADLSASTIDVSSSGGGVLLELSLSPTNVHVTSDGGSIQIEVPDNAATYRVNVLSEGGATSTEIRTDPVSTRVITATASGGNVTLRYASP